MVLRLACILSLLAAAQLPAQEQAPVGVQRRSWSAFGIEAGGGVLGATLGYGVVAAFYDTCLRDDDFVSCSIGPAAAAIATSTVGAAVGTIVAGRAGRTGVSALGATVGALLGAVSAVGSYHLLTEEMDVRLSRVGTTFVVGAAQGLTAALVSRLFATWSR